ncbi:MAG: DUF3579 domain-containing protein [Gammaproteobacteria bacterium]|nr:DUF3579 domain-containing protein [Gammaproteobacteria bacterium]
MGISEINDSTIIIEGQTKDGRKFRPSDWAERMSGVLSTFGKDHRIHYSAKLKPLSINGLKCVALNASLKDEHPELFSYLMDFAEMNKLNVINGTDAINQTDADAA